jgi:hypothetical protein
MRTAFVIALLMSVLLSGPRAAAGDFGFRSQVQLGMGREQRDYPASTSVAYSWSVKERLYDLGVMIEGMNAFEMANGLDGELGGLLPIQFDLVHTTITDNAGGLYYSRSTSTALRGTLGICPQFAARFQTGDHGYMRPFVSVGPMMSGEIDLGDGGVPSGIDGRTGTTLRVGVEAGADGLPVCAALGYQSFSYDNGTLRESVVFLVIGTPFRR